MIQNHIMYSLFKDNKIRFLVIKNFQDNPFFYLKKNMASIRLSIADSCHLTHKATYARSGINRLKAQKSLFTLSTCLFHFSIS
jgi:hypothetical protein